MLTAEEVVEEVAGVVDDEREAVIGVDDVLSGGFLGGPGPPLEPVPDILNV